MTTMIHVENLVKDFGDLRVLHNLSFDVEQGEVLGFLGPNGAGKTTTMRIITCFFPPSSGIVEIGGFNSVKKSHEIRRIIGYLPEGVPLYKELSVELALRFFAQSKGYYGKNAEKAIEEASSECQLLDVRKRSIGHLSKGYRQRVGLAQAIIGDPKILILDEPTVGLDPQQIVEIRELIKKMKGRRTVILSTHILPEVQMTCSKVLIINRGHIAAAGTPENLTTSHVHQKNKFSLSFRGTTAPKMLNALKELPFVSSATQVDDSHCTFVSTVDTPGNDIAQMLIKNHWQLVELKGLSPTLEDVFLEVISGENHDNLSSSVADSPEKVADEASSSEEKKEESE